MAEIMTDQVQDTNSKIAERMQEEEVTTVGTPDKVSTESVVVLDNNGDTTITTVPIAHKKTRNRVAKTVTTGKVDTKVLIAGMKEKVATIEWIDGAYPDTDIPTPLSAKAREVLIKLQKDVETAKSAAITAIQSA